MAAKTFLCSLITPAAEVLKEQVTYASIPAWDGLFGVMPGRAPIVAKLGLGELRLDFPDSGNDKGGSRSFLVEDGFVQMVNNNLKILATRAIPTETIAEADAKAELAEAASRSVPADHPDRKAEAERIARDRRRAELKVRLARTGRAI
jgi:F-type H+-transporting ATPase subunit epsilon